MRKNIIVGGLSLVLSICMPFTCLAFDTVKVGDNSEVVAEIQSALIEKGYLTGTADGVFGAGTENAVMKFQEDNGLDATGMVGEATYNLLVDQLSSTVDEAENVSSISELTGNTFTEGDFEYAELKDGTLQIINYFGEDDSVTISSELNGAEITEIGAGAFKGNEKIEDIICWADIRFFGNEAFKGCTKLSSISIPSETKSIGISCFEGCSSLKTVLMWADLEEIPECAFKDCSELESMSISSSVVTIGKSAFENCTSLESVLIWGSERIEEAAFKNCISIENISLPSDVIYVGTSAFSGCEKLDNVTIWNNDIEIVENAFDGCKYQLDKEKYNILPVPEESKNTSNEQDEQQEESVVNSDSGVTPSFKETMDSYEQFFESYVEFMQSYDQNDVSSALKYVELLSQYTEMIDKMDNIDEESLSEADLAYYIEVTARIEKLLLSVS